MNCGRCGRPIYEAGQPICKFCKKTMSKGASKKADRMNKKKDQEEEMFANISGPGEEETEDVSEKWVEEDFMESKGKRR